MVPKLTEISICSRSMSLSRCAGSHMPVVGCGERLWGTAPMPHPTPEGLAQIRPSMSSWSRPSAFTTRGAFFLYGPSSNSSQGANFSCT